MIKRFEQKNGDSQGLQRFHVMMNLALAWLRGQAVMKNMVMHHPPMVKDDFQITELLKPPFSGGQIF